jgi:hypothetical protein
MVAEGSHRAICPLSDWMYVWKLNPEWLESLWLNGCAVGGGIILSGISMIYRRQAVLFLNSILAFAL